MNDLRLPLQSVKMNELMKRYPQLSGLSLKSLVSAKARILIGLNNARLGYVKQYVDCPPDGPIAVETPLGWILYGSEDTLKSRNHVH